MDGHAFVSDALGGGAVVGVVRADWGGASAPVIRVADPLDALQRLAAWHRSQSIQRVVAITGSNGKTIVKDALVALLASQFRVAGSPGSYNSQVGVPLSVLAAPEGTEVGVFEAGVSKIGEMKKLLAILQPDCGVLTNIGLAHLAGFGDRQTTAREKILLFSQSPGWVIGPMPGDLVADQACATLRQVIPLGDPAIPVLRRREVMVGGSVLIVEFPGEKQRTIPVRTRSQELITDLMAAISAG